MLRTRISDHHGRAGWFVADPYGRVRGIAMLAASPTAPRHGLYDLSGVEPETRDRPADNGNGNRGCVDAPPFFRGRHALPSVPARLGGPVAGYLSRELAVGLVDDNKLKAPPASLAAHKRRA